MDFLGILPADGPPEAEPMVREQAKREELRKQRQEASQARWAACGDHKTWLAEKDWRKQVSSRKALEKRRRDEAALCAEQRRREEEALRLCGPPLSLAEQAEAAAKAAAEAAQRAAREHWLETEWAPRLRQKQEEGRIARLAEDARKHEERMALQERKSYEYRGMELEDARGRQLEAFLESECQRLTVKSQTPRVQESIEKKIELVLEMKGLEIRWKQGLEKRRREEEEARLLVIEERKEREYREWKREVREERVRCRRVVAREEDREKELRDWKALELLGRDVLREEELRKKELLEEAFRTSSAQRRRLEAQGVEPQRVLLEAKALAERQRKAMEATGPKQAEQELWEALIAKNRVAMKQKQSTRWGIFS